MPHASARSAIVSSRRAFVICRFDRMDAASTPTVTIPMMMVDSALISGLTPSRTEEKILIGSVVADGPAVKLAITRSSSDSVKAKSQPAITAGAMIGSVTDVKAWNGVHPKSKAASSSDRSKLTSREDTTTDNNT